VTYPQSFVREAIEAHCVPVQINNSLDEAKELLKRFRHVWTPDLRILDDTGMELYRWNGFLPPAEFAPRLLAGVGHARLRRREFDKADPVLQDLLLRFPTSFAAPEASYFLAVTRYRASGEAKDLLHGWHELEKIYPGTEWAAKQNFD
jgi:hypothetical protein